MLSETVALGASALLIIIAILAQVTLALPQFGLGYLASPRDEGRKLAGMSGRLDRAVNNAAIGFALVAPALVLVISTGGSTAQTLLAANLYLWARIVYFVLYWFGVPWLRTAAWLVGLGATVWLWIMLF